MMPRYRVQLFDRSGVAADGYLEEAVQADLPSLGKVGWTFDWRGFWQDANFDCEAFIKLHCQGKLLGLIHFGAYPNPTDRQEPPEYVYIYHLQCVSIAERDLNPVGFWLIWYAAKVSLEYCVGDPGAPLIWLDSLESSIRYYRKKVKMDELGNSTTAPGEEGYAFGFTQEGAEKFCRRIEQEYGSPLRLD